MRKWPSTNDWCFLRKEENDLAIVPLVKPTTSDTRILFDQYIMGGQEEAGQPVADTSTVVKLPYTDLPIGIDMGLKHFMTDSYSITLP